MTTLADQVHAKIQAQERLALKLENGIIDTELNLNTAEIQAFCAAFGGDPNTLDVVGVVRIFNSDLPRAPQLNRMTRKVVNINDDVSRYNIALANAQRDGLPLPFMPLHVKEHLDAQKVADVDAEDPGVGDPLGASPFETAIKGTFKPRKKVKRAKKLRADNRVRAGKKAPRPAQRKKTGGARAAPDKKGNPGARRSARGAGKRKGPPPRGI